MTILSEQERVALERAYSDNGFTGTFTLPEFRIAFEAGLTYNKARIEELEARIKELQNELISTGTVNKDKLVVWESWSSTRMY